MDFSEHDWKEKRYLRFRELFAVLRRLVVSQGAKCDIDPVACCEIGFEFLLGPVTLVDAVIDAHARLIGCQSTLKP